jgi:Tfp pilus assembly protein PilF
MVKEGGAISGKLKYGLLCFTAIVTFLCYSRTLQNTFTNWDDDVYLTDNSYVKNLSPVNVKMLLLHNITNNYYHPITMLSIAANYHFSKMEPMGYYFTNVFIHVLNTCLMFLLVLMLLASMEEQGYGIMKGKEWLAAIGALLFGIHPMHVESVAWLAERKDLLYAFFYFLGLITYVKYTKEEKIKWMVWVIAFYMLSLLSKPQAIVFPLSLLALDVLLKRKIDFKIFREKLPLFVLSLGAGILTYKAQMSSGAVNAYQSFTLMQRAMVPFYGFVIYVVKSFIPTNLCAFYPYPALTAAGKLPGIFYLMPLLALCLILLPIYMARKAGENYLRVVVFGIAFYIFNMILVLQIVSFGTTIMSERYTYVSYFGIFFILMYLTQILWIKMPSFKLVVLGLFGLWICVLGFICYNRTKVWQNTETLWNDVIKKYPDRVELAYNSLGSYYCNKGNIDVATGYFQKAIDMHSGDAKVYANMGNIYAMRKQYREAFSDYNQAIKLDNNDFKNYLDRGVSYSILGKFDSAESDYIHAYKLDSTSEKLLGAIAYNYLNSGAYDKAIAAYKRAIRINPEMPIYYQKLAVAEAFKGDTTSAFSDFRYSLQINPKNGDCMLDISLTYKQLGNYSKALEFANKAQQAGYKLPDSYISDLQQSVNSPVK